MLYLLENGVEHSGFINGRKIWTSYVTISERSIRFTHVYKIVQTL